MQREIDSLRRQLAAAKNANEPPGSSHGHEEGTRGGQTGSATGGVHNAAAPASPAATRESQAAASFQDYPMASMAFQMPASVSSPPVLSEIEPGKLQDCFNLSIASPPLMRPRAVG